MPHSGRHIHQELVLQSPAGEPDRALDHHQILLAGINVGLFKGRIGIALEGGHKAGAHLDPAGTEFYEASDIVAVINPSGGNDRNSNAMLAFDPVHLGHDRDDEVFQAIGRIIDLLGFETQVPTGLGAFDHHRIGQIAVALKPSFTDQGGGPGRRDDRSQPRAIPVFQKAGQVQRQAGTGKNDVNLFGDGRFDQIGKMRQGHHNVDTDDPLRLLLGFADLARKGPAIGRQAVGGDILFGNSGHGASNDADAAGIGHGRSQAGHGNTHAHTPLDDREPADQMADSQFWHIHGEDRHRPSENGL